MVYKLKNNIVPPLGPQNPPDALGKQFGRISGPLLANNLRRTENLAFDTSVLFLNVQNKYVGFNTNSPVRDLTISGNTRSPDVIATTSASIGRLTFGGVGNLNNKIADFYGENIIIQPAQGVDPIIQLTGIGSTDKWGFVGATMTGYVNEDFILKPSGTGQVVIGDSLSITDVEIAGNLRATGTITFDGDITLGNDDTDNITFSADVASNIVPDDDAYWNLGAGVPTNKNWLTTYSVNLVASSALTATNLTLTTLTAGDVRFTGNQITNIVTNEDINFYTFGSGVINLPTFTIDDNLVTHTTNNPTLWSATGTGYFKFGGNTGLTLPSGTTFQRPTSPNIGTVRYNSTLQYLEVYANVADTSTVTLVNTNADSYTSGTTVYTNTTTGFTVGDFITSTTVPSAFASDTIITSINTNISVTIDKPLINNLPSGSQISVQRKWIPVIGTSPVLTLAQVEETMDLMALIFS